MPVVKFVIGVSSCLIGHRVRYDGDDKRNSIVEEEICQLFSCVPLCPEYAIGLGVPRNPVHLVGGGKSLKVLSMANDSPDISLPLQKYADFVCDSLPQINGYIFKARSPSCGLIDTPVFNELGAETSVGPGIYATRIIQKINNLPVIDENQLADPAERRKFIQKVHDYSLDIQRRR